MPDKLRLTARELWKKTCQHSNEVASKWQADSDFQASFMPSKTRRGGDGEVVEKGYPDNI